MAESLAAEDRQRFWSRVEKTSGCWEWQRGIGSDGYGRFWVNGKQRLAHRVAAMLAGLLSTLDSAECVLHKCDNRRCVRLDHLFLGDREANQKDMAAKGRGPRGRKNAHAKLNDESVREIRCSTAPLSVLAAEFNVSRSLVCMVRKRQRWRHVD